MRGQNLKIGSTVWVFDYNHRVYAKNSGISGSPIYREHFVAHEITGETSRSWIIGISKWNQKKISKTNPDCYVSIEEVNDACWLNDHRYKVIQLAWRADGATIRKIAKLIGYDG